MPLELTNRKFIISASSKTPAGFKKASALSNVWWRRELKVLVGPLGPFFECHSETHPAPSGRCFTMAEVMLPQSPFLPVAQKALLQFTLSWWLLFSRAQQGVRRKRSREASSPPLSRQSEGGSSPQTYTCWVQISRPDSPSLQGFGVHFHQGNLGDGILKLYSTSLGWFQNLWDWSLWVVILPFPETSVQIDAIPTFLSSYSGWAILPSVIKCSITPFLLNDGHPLPSCFHSKRGNSDYSSSKFSVKLSASRSKKLPGSLNF